MKIEIGESLIYSFLRHEKKCLITQTNWKPSGNWNIPDDIRDRAIYEFDKINKHHAFSGIFKSDFNQTIRQAEIDVLGVGQDNRIYAFEVAFHENGLQYGGKIETRNRVFKKLLRGYITLKCFFPEHEYFIAFCSPKVNPATETHIADYFEVLMHDFKSDEISFHCYSNDMFNTEIAQKTLVKTVGEADSSELFARSIKLLNITNKFEPVKVDQPVQKDPLPRDHEAREPDPPVSSSNHIRIGNISIPTTKSADESVQDYVKKVMRLLLNNEILTQDELRWLQDKEYCKKTFFLQLPMIRNTAEGYKDNTGRGRYWSKEIFGGKYYVCSQWWKDHHPTYLAKIGQWLERIEKKHKQGT